MGFDEEIDKRVEKEVENYIRKYLIKKKDSEEEEIVEEVFDKTTLMNLYYLVSRGVIYELKGVVSSGKEARVYAAIDNVGNPLAVKIYLVWTAEFRRGRLKYILGDPRFEELDNNPRKLINAWASKEFKNLKRAYEAGVYVPRPIKHYKNIIVMEFIGDNFTPAPLLREKEAVTEYMLLQIIRQVKILYSDAELVHADLSEYNIFYYRRKPIIFDFGQAVVKTHPSAEAFLARDVQNILDFFRNRGVDTPEYEDILNFILYDEEG